MWHALRASNFAGRNRVEIDAGVVPALLNARYYESTRGQFIAQDPSFLSVGDPSQVKQLTGRDQQAFLADPQQMNSYSYGRDNPITNKDQNGKYVEFSGTVVIPGRTFSAGLRFDSSGIDYFMSGGVGFGAEAGVELAWAPGVELSHRPTATASGFGEVAYGLGGRISTDIVTYDLETKRKLPNGDPTMALVVGGGAGGGIGEELSAPVPYMVWGNPKPLQGSLVPSPLNTQTYISAPRQSYAPQTQTYSGSGGSFGGSSLGQTLSGPSVQCSFQTERGSYLAY